MQDENEPTVTRNEDELLASEPRGFSQEELVKCESCQRANPPTRTSCLYCGATLPITDAGAKLLKPTLRPLESWEQGFNAVLLPGEQTCSALNLKTLSELLRLEFEALQVMMASRAALPVARCASADEATLVLARLTDMGLKVVVIPDSVLDASAPKRIRTIDMTNDSLVVYPSGREAARQIPWHDISLMVAGRRIVRRLEVAERILKRNEKEVVSSRELSTDAERLDLYSRQDETAWRIAADNFDFSCLQEKKALVALKNFQILTATLRTRAEFAVYDDSYLRVRQSVSLVWPVEQRTESLGLRKPRAGRINTEAATTSDNELQFTRYSRLLYHLKTREPELKV